MLLVPGVHAQVCCWEDDDMSEPPGTPTLKHVKSDAAVEISSRRSTAATTEVAEAVRAPGAALPATLAVAAPAPAPAAVGDHVEAPVLVPVEGNSLTSPSPRRLTGSTPATIRTV